MRNQTLQTSTILATAVALGLPAAAALGQGQSDQNRGDEQAGQTVITGQEGHRGGDLSPEQAEQITKSFFEDEASANQFEIKAAQLAEERSSNDQVKRIARTIIEGHEKALDLLRQEAREIGVEISEQPELNEVHSAMLDALKEKPDEAFDRAYVFEQSAAHLKTGLLLNHVVNDLPNDSARAYASSALPHVEHHGKALDQLASEMSGYEITWDEPEARTAGAEVGDDAENGQQGQRDRQEDARQDGNQDREEVDVERWFQHAASTNRYGHETAQLAVEKGARDQVKRLAQRIEEDHQQASELLKRHAEQAGVEIDDEPELLPVHEARLAKLREMDGPAFDAHYVFDAAAMHRKHLLEHTWAGENAGAEAVRTFARESIETLRQHQQQVKPLTLQLSGQDRVDTRQDEESGQRDSQRETRDRQ